MIHPLLASERFFDSFHKKRPVHERKSVGPENRERAPSAKNFKAKIWRPIAAMAVVVATASVYDDYHPVVNSSRGEVSAENVEFLDGLPSEGFLDGFGLDSFSVSDLPEEKLEAEIFKQENQDSAEGKAKESSELFGSDPVRITGYYCEQVVGYPIGDGGGYCGNTASGEPVRPGVAACSLKWPLGTILEIEGLGKVECLDKGNLGDDQVDVFYPTNKDLAQSGKPSFARVRKVTG